MSIGHFFDQAKYLLGRADYNDKRLFENQQLKDPDLLQQISACLKNNKVIIVLYLDIVKEFEQNDHNFSYADVYMLKLLRQIIKKEMPGMFGGANLLAVDNLWGKDYIILIAVDQSNNIMKELPDLIMACSIALQNIFKKELALYPCPPFDFHTGYSLICSKSGNLEVQLYKAVRESQDIARDRLSDHKVRLFYEFKDILANSRINMVYQPIVSLNTGFTIGWEALARGPADSIFHSPANLFPFAEEGSLLFPLEKICRQVAINNLGRLEPGQKIFLNIHPNTVSDPNFKPGETMKIIMDTGLDPQNIVFEITERHRIDDYSFLNRTIDHYRNQGFLVAVDDAGAGFSSLQSIAELRPDYIKIDMSLVRDIYKNSVKQALLETMVTFAEKIDSSIVAEGIENENDLLCLAGIGVHFGQGYYLGKPNISKQLPDQTVCNKLLSSIEYKDL